MTYFENGVNSAECQGVETQTVLSRGLLAEESMLSWGASRSRVYGFALGVVALFFLIPRAFTVTIHLYVLGVQGIDWLGRLLHQRKAANQSRTACVPAANS